MSFPFASVFKTNYEIFTWKRFLSLKFNLEWDAVVSGGQTQIISDKNFFFLRIQIGDFNLPYFFALDQLFLNNLTQ